MSAKGKTRWFPRHVHPVRSGQYECRVRIMGGLDKVLRNAARRSSKLVAKGGQHGANN